MKTIVLGHGDLDVAARPSGAAARRSVLRPWESSVLGAFAGGRTERPTATLPTDPTLDQTAHRTT
ncbi:hypothetical protein ACQE98_05935 [Ornithinimicrobium sp. W1679]|uniref:hypothetical protein n=1 Tax=unclassified Ornithinimicrobium TaxID=2615080 RepID=UPI003CEA9EF9